MVIDQEFIDIMNALGNNKPEVLHLTVNQKLYDQLIKDFGENGGFIPTKVVLKTYPKLDDR